MNLGGKMLCEVYLRCECRFSPTLVLVGSHILALGLLYKDGFRSFLLLIK